jgi:biopolymer transport protein TolR
MSTGNKNDNRGLAEINVTPLVDVMLVLLIIFMVSAPMMQSGIDINLPVTDQGKTIEEQRVVISLTQEGKLYINDEIIHPKLFDDKIKKIAKLKGEVYLKGDKNIPYGEIIKLIGKLKKAGIENVALVTSPLEEEQNK